MGVIDLAVFLMRERSTRLVLFNHSTAPHYNDTVELMPVLQGPQQQSCSGVPIRIRPYGFQTLDVGDCFPLEALKPIGFSGSASVVISHVGHIFSSFFFHTSRIDGSLLDGQHTQPPANAFAGSGIWWGRLRQLVV